MTVALAEMTGLLDRYAGDGQAAVVVGLYQGDEVLDTTAVGYASIEHAVPATAQTLFDLASVSKHFTSTCLLLLERDGKLSLDDDLRDHLPGMHLREKVTLRQCAQHTAGLRDYMATNDLVGAGEWSWRTEEQVIRLLSRQRDTDFPPGSSWSYSNTGYIALAAVVRAVSGQGLAAFSRERIFEPLGMAATRFQDDATAVVAHRASGYGKDDDGFHRADSGDDIVGDGGLLTTVTDLARWNGFLTGGRVLGAEIRDRLLTRAVLTDGTTIPYALGIEHETVCGRDAVSHGGAISGFRAHLLVVPGDGLGVAVLANRSDANPSRVAEEVLATYLGAARPSVSVPAARQEPEPSGDPAGLWYADVEEMFLETEQAEPERLMVCVGPTSLPFVPDGSGGWKPETLDATITVRVDGDTLVLAIGAHDWNPIRFRRMAAAPATVAASAGGLVGDYLSVELGAVARVGTDEEGALTVAVGAAEVAPLLAVHDDLLRTSSHAVHVERDEAGAVTALLFSVGRARRLRFDRMNSPATLVGFPICLGGPLDQAV